MKLNEIIDRICVMSGRSSDRLASCMEEVRSGKGVRLFEAGKTESSVYFISKGIARAYIPGPDGREVTFWIGKEGDALFSLKSYVYGIPGYESIQLMEDSILSKVEKDSLERLFKEDIEIANWGRKLAEKEFVNTPASLSRIRANIRRC